MSPHIVQNTHKTMYPSCAIFFCFIIYDHEMRIAHESVSTYIQCGSFYWVVIKTPPPPLKLEEYGKM